MRGVETEGKLWCAARLVKEDVKLFSSAKTQAPTRMGQSLRACKPGGDVPEAEFCLHYSPLLEKEVS